MEIFSHTAISGITSRTEIGSTLTPMANPTDILTCRIREKHICTLILTLCHTLEPAGRFRKISEISIFIDSNQQINIFWISFGTEDRAEHRTTPDTRNLDYSLNKAECFGEKKCSNIFVNWLHIIQI